MLRSMYRRSIQRKSKGAIALSSYLEKDITRSKTTDKKRAEKRVVSDKEKDTDSAVQ